MVTGSLGYIQILPLPYKNLSLLTPQMGYDTFSSCVSSQNCFVEGLSHRPAWLPPRDGQGAASWPSAVTNPVPECTLTLLAVRFASFNGHQLRYSTLELRRMLGSIPPRQEGCPRPFVTAFGDL